MKTSNRRTFLFRVFITVVGTLLPAIGSGEEKEDRLAYVTLESNRFCDDYNRDWSIKNTHTYRSIKLTVQWRMQMASPDTPNSYKLGDFQFSEVVIGPQKVALMGCRYKLNVVAVELMDF